jgi:hypothetical protein
MNRSLEQSLVERWSGLKIIKTSLAIGLAGTLPLLLYIAIGPSDGNPIGLGLLAVVAIPIAVIGTLVGLVKSLVQIARR